VLRVLVPLLFAVAAIGGCGLRAESGEDAAKRLDSEIGAEIPKTAPRSQVEAWLDRRGIAHDFSVDTTRVKVGSQTMPMLAGFRDENLGGMVVGTIQCPGSTLRTHNSGRVTICFFLDSGGICVGRFVHWFGYSL
jgi:hypothetical protein